jgi:hypothetical protein
MAASVAAALLEIERDRLLGSISHLERSVDELKAAIAEEGPDQDYRDAIDENVVVIAKYKARVAALEDEIQKVKSGSTALLSAVPVVDEDNMQQAIQQLRQQMGRATPSGQATAEQQQQQDTAAAGQHSPSSMEVDTASSAAATGTALSAGADSSSQASRQQQQQQQQQQQGGDGVWL